MVRLAVLVMLMGALSPTRANGQAVPYSPYFWFHRLQSVTNDSVIAVAVGQVRIGQMIQVTLADSAAFARSWREQERRAKVIAAFVFAHADTTPPLALARIQYQASPKANPVPILRVFRFVRPAANDSLSDAQETPPVSAPATAPRRS